MGLDISLSKLFIPTDELIDRANDELELDFAIVSILDHEELRIFKDYIFLTKVERLDIPGTFSQRGLNFDDFVQTSVGNTDGSGTCFNYQHITDDTKLSIRFEDVQQISTIEECILTKSIGYQRKGENSQFHEDGIWDIPLVADQNTLMRHWEIYFSETEAQRQNFKTNIIDRFIEGETFVWYA